MAFTEFASFAFYNLFHSNLRERSKENAYLVPFLTSKSHSPAAVCCKNIWVFDM